MRSFWAAVWFSCRPVVLWSLFIMSGAAAIRHGHSVLGIVLMASSGYPTFLRGFRLGVDHERRRRALEAKELDLFLEEEPDVLDETSDGHPLH
jgi:hypothetical protein